MRLLLVGTEMAPVLPGRGGVEHLILGWATELSARHDVIVASIGSAADVVPSESEPFTRAWLESPQQLSGLAAELDVDVVQVNNRPGWVRFAGDNAVVGLHNHPYAWHDPDRPESADDIGAGLSAARAIITISRSLHARVSEWGAAGKATVVYPFAGPVFFEEAGAPKQRTVLFPNRLLRKKGVEVVLEVARQMAADETDSVAFAFLDFIAPSSAPTPEHRELRQAVAATPGCTLLPPPPDRRGLARLMAQAAVVLVPSLEDEGFGLTSIEAQAAGTRVIVSDRGALPETVRTADHVVPSGDDATLRRRIEEALSHPQPDPAATQWVASRFSRRQSAEALERVLVAAAGQRAA